MNQSKKARNLIIGDRIIFGKGEEHVIGVVDFIYKYMYKIHILVKTDTETAYFCYERTDQVPIQE